MGFSANQLRPGMVIEYEGALWQCLEAQHRTPGNKRAFMQAKMRNVEDGLQKEFRFSSTDVLERAILRERQMQFLYKEGDFYNFMDTENYEQIQLGEDAIGTSANFLMPDAVVTVTLYEEKPLGVKLPSSMIFTVTEAEPGMKTATASASKKNAKIETGMTVKVPQFIEIGEKIIINTETGEYLERAKK